MKTSLRLGPLLVLFTLLVGLEACKIDAKQTHTTSTKESQTYHGLSADKILSMTDQEAKEFRKEKEISLADWIILRNELRAKKYNKEAETLKKETDKVYDEVEQTLGIEKQND